MAFVFKQFTVWILLLQCKCDILSSQNCKSVDKCTFECDNYIPKEIPPGICNVVLTDFETSVEIASSTFEGQGWQNVTALTIILKYNNLFKKTEITFKSNCFMRLSNLEELRLHIAHGNYEDGFFNELNLVKLLDLSNTTDLPHLMFRSIFSSRELPRLKDLSLVGTKTSNGNGLELDDKFWSFVGERNITHLDISYTDVHTLNTSALLDNCDSLVYFKARGTNIQKQPLLGENTKRCGNLRLVDISEMKLPKLEWCEVPVVNSTLNETIVMSVDYLEMFSNSDSLYLDHICAQYRNTNDKPQSIILRPRVRFTSNHTWNVSTLSLKKYRLDVVDTRIVCENPVLHSLSLAENDMKYLAPDCLSCLTSLKRLDLSKNRLGFMRIKEFEQLFTTLEELVHIDLSENALCNLLENQFSNNSHLETIILANNEIKHVTFKLSHLKNLRYLDISYNFIHLVDEASINHLSGLIRPNDSAIINLSSNPIMCRECSHHSTIDWLLKNGRQFLRNNITCVYQHKKRTKITVDVTRGLSDLCLQTERVRNAVLLIMTLPTIFISLLIIFSSLFKQYLKRRDRSRRKDDVLRLILKGKADYEFLLFLAFSSDDEVFVRENVLGPLTDIIRQQTGTDRNLICMGDSHFKLGKHIHEQVFSCLQRTRVVIAVLTDSFIQSVHCKDEFQQACRLNKAIVFMVREQVDEKLMSPEMKHHYDINTRIIWTRDKDRYVLKTSWHCICESILDLASTN